MLNPDLLSPAFRAAEAREVLKRDDMARASGALVDLQLIISSVQEWQRPSNKVRAATPAPPKDSDDCTPLLRHHGLCTTELLRLPPVKPEERPFVFVHLSKCGGTSLLSGLARQGLRAAAFERQLPRTLPPNGRTCHESSQKCCWWAERLRRNASNFKLLQTEPANAFNGQDPSTLRLVRHAEPGFEVSRDHCAFAAYVIVLRPPVERTHSHMCEVNANLSLWQNPNPRRSPFDVASITKQLRDNYFVRALGGAEAWVRSAHATCSLLPTRWRSLTSSSPSIASQSMRLSK